MTLVDFGQLYRRYPDSGNSGRLGRHLWLDSRSLAYMVETSPELMSRRLTDRAWERRIPILDQRELGACVGFAAAAALGTEPFWDRTGVEVVPVEVPAAEEFAVALYSDATRADVWPGTWPPQDTGSSGLAACKVLKRRGTIAGYRWARSPYGLLRLLQDGPVLLGMPWFDVFFTPDRAGFIDQPGWRGSSLAGGHEVAVVGCEVDHSDVLNSVLTLVNSWGEEWGDSGYFRMHLRGYTLMSGADLKQIVP